jgi:hypothetical protein
MGKWFGGKFVRYSNNTCVPLYPLSTLLPLISALITAGSPLYFYKIDYEGRM